MPEDASLDQFASSDAAETADDADPEPDDDSESAEESAVSSENVEPAVSTYRWSPDGGECADCGASVGRRWRAEGQRDGDLVCSDCKEW